MNIVDVIKSQLGGEILGKLSSLIGENEDKTKTAVTAAVPSLLSVLAQLASSSSGADKVINALKQVDTGSGGGLGDILSGQAGHVAEKGGSLLNILLGSSALPAIISILGKFSGIAAGPLKTLLSYLAPMILATIAKQFVGKSLTSQALSSFFAEQSPNINAALPPGLSLASIPGFTTTTAATAPRPVASTAAKESSGLPGWLLPLVGLGLLGALAWYFFGNQPAVEEKPAPVPAPVVKREEPKPVVEPVVVKREEPKPVVERVVPKVELPAVPDPTKIGTDLGAIYTSLTDLLGGIEDVPTAEAAIPKLTDLTPKIDGLQALWNRLPYFDKATVAKVTTDHLARLKELVTRVLAIPGVSDQLKPVVNTLVDKLAAFTVH
jgi:Bacterial protein of unknown function (DUF937)